MFIYQLVSPKTRHNVKKIHTMRKEVNSDPAVRCNGRARAENAFFYTTTRLSKKLRSNHPSSSKAIIIIIKENVITKSFLRRDTSNLKFVS